MEQLTFWSAAHLASLSASPDLEKDWQTRVATSCSPIWPLLTDTAPTGWFGRTSPAFCHPTADGISLPSSAGWQNAGMGSLTECLTLAISEYPSVVVASSLSAMLEAGNVPQRYFLSARACAGILSRAARREKVLPPLLEAALHQSAECADSATT